MIDTVQRDSNVVATGMLVRYFSSLVFRAHLVFESLGLYKLTKGARGVSKLA
jgi:hypothetical protein